MCRQRPGRQHLDPPGDHVRWQLFREMPAQDLCICPADRVRRYPAAQPQATRPIRLRHHQCLSYTRTAAQGHGYLLRLHTLPADLHLLISPAHEQELTIGQKPRKVAAPVKTESTARIQRIFHETIPRQRRVVDIATARLGAADPQLTRHAGWYPPATRVHHPQDGVGERTAYGRFRVAMAT